MNIETTSYPVSNLKKYTKYDFFLVPFYKSVEGQPSNSMIVQTAEDGKNVLVLKIKTQAFIKNEEY